MRRLDTSSGFRNASIYSLCNIVFAVSRFTCIVISHAGIRECNRSTSFELSNFQGRREETFMRRIQPYGFLCYSVAILMKMHYFSFSSRDAKKGNLYHQGHRKVGPRQPLQRNKGGGARIKRLGLCAFSVAFNTTKR